jgi:hypothetical protein
MFFKERTDVVMLYAGEMYRLGEKTGGETKTVLIQTFAKYLKEEEFSKLNDVQQDIILSLADEYFVKDFPPLKPLIDYYKKAKNAGTVFIDGIEQYPVFNPADLEEQTGEMKESLKNYFPA